ncbi:MAG: restriction endonuclease subunit S [Bacteroidales bacterium]|nr:restriction endonuclease subunit S [Bacteroidales bacterium]
MAKTYDTYKDSGIAWIGEIPSEWEVKRLGNFYNPRNEKVSDKDFAPLSVTMKGIVPQLETAAKTDDGDNRKLVREGDFVINSRSDRRGSCGISEFDGSVSLINIVLCPKGKMDAGFFNWLFHTSMFADEYYKWGHGIVDDLWTTRWSEMKNIYVVNPSLSEQQSIATFLDTKCVEIDALISLQEEMISELQAYKQSVITEAVTKGLNPHAKMKDSGVEWIGEIPEGWAVCSTKHLFNLYSGATPKTDNDSFWDGNIPWITPADFKTEDVYISKGRRNITQNGVDSCGTTIVPANSVIFSKRAPIGLVVLNKEPLCTNQGCISCVPKETFSKYYYYAMSVFTDSYELYGAGTTFMEISATSFANFKLPNPSFEEQHSIATYLDEKTSQIDSLIALKQEKIQELKDYKKSIIYEYVTGKKRV